MDKTATLRYRQHARFPMSDPSQASTVASPSARADDPASGLQTRAVRGALFTFFRYGGAQMVRLVGNIVLTRLLFAEAFGLMALITVLSMGLEMVSDIGIGPSIIRSKRGDDPDFLDTIWTAQIVRGVGMWLVASALAVPFAAFYQEPVLEQMIPVVTFGSVIAGFASTKRYTLNRHLRLGRVMVMEIAAQAIGTLVMILLALWWRSVWALAIGTLIMRLARTVLSFVGLPGRNNRLRWEKAARAELVGFGRWVFLSTLLTFASQNTDRLIFGKLFSMSVLGVYGIGKVMASAPIEAIGQISSSVVFPLYSRAVASGTDLRDTFIRSRRPLLVLAGWGLAVASATGDSVIQLFYDQRYAEAGWVLQLVALSGWFNVLWTTHWAALLALGHPNWMAATTGVKTVAVAILIPLGYAVGKFYGDPFRGAVVGFGVAEVVQLVMSAAVIARHRLAPFWHDLPMTGLVLVSIAVGFYVCGSLVGSLPLWLGHKGVHTIALLGGALVVTAMWLPVGWPLLRALRGANNPLRP